MDEKFGKKAIDIITEFTGIIVGKCEYIYGCTQYGLAPKISKDGKRGDIEWFDEGRLKILGGGVKINEVRTKDDGCEYQSHPKN